MPGQGLQALQRKKRHRRVRVKLKGSAQRPRLAVYRSHKNIYAQLVDDTSRKTLFSFSTQSKEMKEKTPRAGNIKAAQLLGELFAEKAKAKGILKVAFDKGAYYYHGRIKAFAESARKGGLEF